MVLMKIRTIVCRLIPRFSKYETDDSCSLREGQRLYAHPLSSANRSSGVILKRGDFGEGVVRLQGGRDVDNVLYSLESRRGFLMERWLPCVGTASIDNGEV